ncbi:MAG: hypothetical protein QOD42_1739 [Sphingomonadales bacterium]|jgi:integrative and conjugative element protein (TIGR02256 family)|nr:hypothetical protein [Sphingomonadales bacterium]
MQEREDVATPTSFAREGLGHAEKIRSAWEFSDNLMTVVGDWHSHPWGSGSPSATDIKAWKVLARASKKPVTGVIVAPDTTTLFWIANKFLGTRALPLTIVENGAVDVTYGICCGI